jgi:hypothetical protein
MFVTLTFTLVLMAQDGASHSGRVTMLETFETLKACQKAAKVIQQAPMPGEITNVFCRAHSEEKGANYSKPQTG